MKPLLTLGWLLLAGCARTSTPPAGFQPFLGSESARVTINGTADEADALVDRLAALGVRTKSKGVEIELFEVRAPAALVRALLAPDWWQVSLVAPEPPPPPREAGDAGTLFELFEVVETPIAINGPWDEAPFGIAVGPDREAVARAAGDLPFVIRCAPAKGCTAYRLLGAPWVTAAELLNFTAALPPEPPPRLPEGGGKKRLQDFGSAVGPSGTRERPPPAGGMTFELERTRRKERNRLQSENVGRPLVLSVAGEALLFAPVQMAPDALVLSFALPDLPPAERHRLGVAIVNLLRASRPTGTASVEKVERL